MVHHIFPEAWNLPDLPEAGRSMVLSGITGHSSSAKGTLEGFAACKSMSISFATRPWLRGWDIHIVSAVVRPGPLGMA
jgi:hypothetical protein